MATKKQEKVQKNVELVSTISSNIEEMKPKEILRMTPFAKQITLSNGSHPHVETVRGKLMEAKLWQDITQKLEFYVKNNKVVHIRKLPEEPNNELNMTELRTEIALLKNKMDTLHKKIDKILKKK